MNGQRLRPLGLGDVFDEGFDLYKRNFVFLLLVTALTVVPLDILLAFLTPRLLPQIFGLFSVTTTSSDVFWAWLLTALMKMLFFFPLLLLAVGPLIAASAGRYLEQDLTLWQVYQPWLRRLPGLVGTLLMATTALNLSPLGCLVLWLAVAPKLFFTLQAFVVERKGPFVALGRSAELAHGYGGRVLNALILLGLVAWVIGLGISFPLAYLVDTALSITPGFQSVASAGGPGQSSEQQVAGLISGGLTHLILIPFLVCVVTVLYYDLRVRKEGFDIETLAQELNYPPLASLGPHLPPVAAFVPPPRMPPSNRGPR